MPHHPECPALPDSYIYKLAGKAAHQSSLDRDTQLHAPLFMDQQPPAHPDARDVPSSPPQHTRGNARHQEGREGLQFPQPCCQNIVHSTVPSNRLLGHVVGNFFIPIGQQQWSYRTQHSQGGLDNVTTCTMSRINTVL